MTDVHGTTAKDSSPPTDIGSELPGTTADAVRMIQAAFARTAAAHELGSTIEIGQADQQLQDAIDGARDIGVGWERIGDSLGIARGNAYHRYRRRPA